MHLCNPLQYCLSFYVYGLVQFLHNGLADDHYLRFLPQHYDVCLL